MDCLAWGAPAWIGGGMFFSQDMPDYGVKFIRGAKWTYGLDMDYIGIWNERKYDAEWIKLLRQTLDKAMTTLKSVGKGNALPPAARPFPLPYGEDFDSYPIGSTPRYQSGMAGIGSGWHAAQFDNPRIGTPVPQP